METCDDPIPKKKQGGKQTKKRKSESVKTSTAEVEHTYGIDRLNLTETVHELENGSIHVLENYSG